MRVLILGGTAEARQLAMRLHTAGHQVITSFAGRTREPLLPPGDIRVGKFGGVPGLAGYLSAARIDRLVDVTHPYAGLMSVNAVHAAAQAGIPMLRLTRTGWTEPPGAGWQHVSDMAEAAAALPQRATVLVTTGHDGLETLFERNDCRFIVRLIERPEVPMPPHSLLVLQRPPYLLENELRLFRLERITHLLTKNSGGSATAAKLEAAQQVGARVIMLRRPVLPPAPEVASVDEAMAVLQG